MSDDDQRQLRQDLEICEFFNLKLDESTDVCDVSQLLVFIEVVFNVGNIKDKIFKVALLHGKTYFKAFMLAFWKCSHS